MADTKLFAVTGNPVLHSKSPCMFNHAFEKMGIDATYFRLAADSAFEAIKIFKDTGLTGMNVTAPFKDEMFDLVDEVTVDAEKIGGINTVVKEGDRLVGYNTDHYGVADSVKQAGITLYGLSAVVIGAGGAGRAAAYGLIKNGAKVTIVNRTVAKAKKAAESFGCKYAGLDSLEEILKKNELIVFSLSQNVNPIKTEWLQQDHLIFDANYKSSPFVDAAKEKGSTIINGEDWLLNQAIPAFKLFLGQNPDRIAMKEGLSTYDLDKKLNKISMIGFMAAGKTKNSKRLGARIHRKAIDSDNVIVDTQHRSIPEIFSAEGEAYFRKLEKDTLEEIIKIDGKHIISCGGGIVVNAQNRKYLKDNTLVIWLFASPEAIVARLKPGKRPLLEVPDPLAKAKELLGRRLHHYAKTADILISTERNIKELTTEKIYDEINSTFPDLW